MQNYKFLNDWEVAECSAKRQIPFVSSRAIDFNKTGLGGA